MTRALVLVTVAFAMWPWARPGAEAQMMMGGGGNRGAGREAKSERLANVTPEQRAYLEALREESEGATAHRVTLRAGTTRYTSGPSEISESLGEVTYRLRTRALTLRVSGEPLRSRVAIRSPSPGSRRWTPASIWRSALATLSGSFSGHRARRRG